MSQRERILSALDAAGVRGVSTTDFLLPDVIDHGAPIIRMAARVAELRKQGYRIAGGALKNGHVRLRSRAGRRIRGARGRGRAGRC
jgi:hypothetical protein